MTPPIGLGIRCSDTCRFNDEAEREIERIFGA
jgi:hypothetical protein